MPGNILLAGITPTKLSVRHDSGNHFSWADSKLSGTLKKFYVPKLIVLVSTAPCL